MVLAGALSACSPAEMPEFVPPIVWDNEYAQGGRVPDRVAVELHEDGQARLTGFPQGRSVEGDEGYYCIDGFAPERERYTGEATWEARTGYSFFVKFGDSKILVSGESRWLGGQDWTEIAFEACGTPPLRWDLGYVCGDSGYGPDDGDPVFRDECPASE